MEVDNGSGDKSPVDRRISLLVSSGGFKGDPPGSRDHTEVGKHMKKVAGGPSGMGLENAHKLFDEMALRQNSIGLGK
ncbi:hypothetical protein D8674_019543 [Pyrus ussuriensis x Pyrus communis]|uniref:Uncharacterized protein n=1 Tax=Pyrus ussuriensis x Pyrus communis TaxID=2448454 RepID=A0A5N5GCP2_9ROSA|nr:hypothetical protein D8674_019543 [Pyrus ussuriensis x Pyrus communis]